MQLLALVLISAFPAAQTNPSGYLKASNTDAGDRFAASVALSGDTLAVGAPGEASRANGFGFDPDDDSAPNSGAVYVYVRSNGAWTQQALLKSHASDANDQFGAAVAIDGDTLVVGAPGEDSSAVGVGGAAQDDGANGSGAAYVFVRSAGTWSLQAYLKASNTQSGDAFGASVAISGDTIVVGAPHEDGGVGGVGAPGGDNSKTDSGAAYVFQRSGGAWTQQAFVKPSNPWSYSTFGGAVALDGDRLVIGASGDDHSSGPWSGTPDFGAVGSGAAYVFERAASGWSEVAFLKAAHPTAWDEFGAAVTISGDWLAVSAPFEDSSATGVNGSQTDEGRSDSGAVFVFARGAGGDWTPAAYLKASNTDVLDGFGASLAMHGGALLVGAPRENSGATCVNCNPFDESAADAGAAYLFTRIGSTWAHAAYLKALNAGADDHFGAAVALWGGLASVGAPDEDSASVGPQSDPHNDLAPQAGAGFAFEFAPPPVLYCTSGTSSNGCTPTLIASGTPSASASSGFVISALGLEGQKLGMLFYSASGPTAVPWTAAPGATSWLCVAPPLGRLPTANSNGAFAACNGLISSDWNAFRSTHFGAVGSPFAPGDVIWMQCWYRDPPAPKATNLSNALEFVLRE